VKKKKTREKKPLDEKKEIDKQKDKKPQDKKQLDNQIDKPTFNKHILTEKTFLRSVTRRLVHPSFTSLLILLIIIEIIFKLHTLIGFFCYLAFLIYGIISVLIKGRDISLSTLLIIPIIRIATTGILTDFRLKLIISSALFLAIIITLFLHHHYDFRMLGFGVGRIKAIIDKKPLIHYLLWSSLVFGILFALLISSIETFPINFSDLLLISVVFAAIAEEIYFRGILLTQNKSMDALFLISILYSTLMFSGNFFMPIIAFFFNLIIGFIFIKYRSIYFPIIAHVTLNVFLVLPKIGFLL